MNGTGEQCVGAVLCVVDGNARINFMFLMDKVIKLMTFIHEHTPTQHIQAKKHFKIYMVISEKCV